MQRQRGRMASLPETFEIDRASSSSGASLDQQLFGNDMSCPSEPHFSGFMLPPNDSSIPFLRSISHEQQSVNGWSLGEASSSSGPYRSINSDWKVESGWASTGGRHCPRIEDQQLGPSNSVLSLDNTNINPVFVQGSGSSSIPPNVNSSGQYVGPSRVNPSLSDHPNLYKSSGFNDNQRFPVQPGNHVDPFDPSGRRGYVREESEVSSGVALDGRRFPCKRKSFEGHIGQSSFIENVNFPQPMESSPWQATPQCSDMNGRPGTQTLQEQVSPRLGLDLAVGAVAQCLPDTENAGVSYRNFRLRVNSSGQSDMRPTSLSSSVVAAAGSPCITLAPQSSSRLLLANRSLHLPTPLASSGSAPQELQPSLQVPVMVPGGHSVRWSRGLIPTNSSSSSSPIIPDEASSSGNLRNMFQQHPVLAPSLSSSNRGLMSASSAGFPANADSAPLGSSTSAAPQLPHHIATQPSHQHPRFPRRLSEYVHRQLLSSVGSDLGGGQGSQTSNSVGRPLLPQDVLLSSGPGRPGHRQSSSRSALWMERHGDSAVRIPYQARSLAAASGGRRRFSSELRNALELVRRGEGGFRFEDVMILDLSMLFGVAEMHDRYRDMRLDVDNMSYEELLALEERIGNVSTGLNEETILARMKQRKHSYMANTQMESEPCCICQEDYNDGEDIGTLQCGHDFHKDCIKQWLMHKNLCPICKTMGLTT